MLLTGVLQVELIVTVVMKLAWFLSLYYYLLNGSYPNGAGKVLKQKIRRHANKLEIRGEALLEKKTLKEVLHEANVRETLEKVHKESHMGPNKLLKQVQSHFVYHGKGLSVLCKAICTECETCQRRARVVFPRRSFARPIPTPGRFNYLWGVDAVGPLPVNEKTKNRYILTSIEYLTRYPVAMAVKDITEEMTAEFYLTQIFYHFGVSQYILSDRGSNFRSVYVRHVLKLLGCKAIHTTSYRPQSNGMVERLNQSLCRTIAKLARDEDNLLEWDKYVGPALMVISGLENESTGFSPAYYLLYGQPLITPGLWMFPIKDHVLGEYEVDVAKRVKFVTEELVDIRKKARERSDQAKARRAIRYDKTVHYRAPFKIGEQVLMKMFVTDNKFQDKWCGPYVVVGCRGDDIYYLEGPNKGKIKAGVNGDALKPFVARKTMIPDVATATAYGAFKTWVEKRN